MHDFTYGISHQNLNMLLLQIILNEHWTVRLCITMEQFEAAHPGPWSPCTAVVNIYIIIVIITCSCDTTLF